MTVFFIQGVKKNPSKKSRERKSISDLTCDGGSAKAPLSILSRFPTHSELSWKSKPG